MVYMKKVGKSDNVHHIFNLSSTFCEMSKEELSNYKIVDVLSVKGELKICKKCKLAFKKAE